MTKSMDARCYADMLDAKLTPELKFAGVEPSQQEELDYKSFRFTNRQHVKEIQREYKVGDTKLIKLYIDTNC